MLPTTLDATYRDGVFHLDQPLELADGSRVSVTVNAAKPQLSDEEVLRRMSAAKSVRELFAAYETWTPPDPTFDLIAAMEETRRQEGRQPLFEPTCGGEK